MKLDSDAFNTTLSFETYAGVKYNNLKFLSLLDSATMQDVGQDPVAGHLQNVVYLPEPQPEAYTDYMYAKFVDAEGNRTYLGVPWVREDSIVNNGTPDVLIMLKAPTQAQIDTMRSIAIASGIENFTVKNL